MDNVSVLTFFFLSGLNYTVQYRLVLFVLTFLYYFVIWMVNIVLIFTIILDKKLHEPMYIFLCNLCINGLYGAIGFYPKFLMDLLAPSHVISYSGCLLQSFVIHSSSGSELSTLAVMAYDRYVAICQPLIYHSVMTSEKISLLVAFSWVLPLFCMFNNVMTVFQTRLCGSHIPKLYCSNALIAKLACSASVAHVAVVSFNIAIYLVHVVLLVCSYMYLVKTCLTSKESRKKFTQTCVPHLVCLFHFVFAVMFDLMYTRFGVNMSSQSLQNFMAIEFLLIHPVMNPVVYVLNLTKIRRRIAQLLSCRGRNISARVDQRR